MTRGEKLKRGGGIYPLGISVKKAMTTTQQISGSRFASYSGYFSFAHMYHLDYSVRRLKEVIIFYFRPSLRGLDDEIQQKN